jgi:hypothetical protein
MGMNVLTPDEETHGRYEMVWNLEYNDDGTGTAELNVRRFWEEPRH